MSARADAIERSMTVVQPASTRAADPTAVIKRGFLPLAASPVLGVRAIPPRRTRLEIYAGSGLHFREGQVPTR